MSRREHPRRAPEELEKSLREAIERGQLSVTTEWLSVTTEWLIDTTAA